MPHAVKGLYAITPDDQPTGQLLQQAGAALQGGARLLQYRNKNRNAALRLTQARLLASLCRDHRAMLIINDDVRLALAVAADGVHLGRDDGDIAAARVQLGEHAIIGASCYNRLDMAQEAVAAGADYVAFGAVFPSATKPDAAVAPLSLFAQAAMLGVPRVAIGGIQLANAGRVIAAGADAIAVIGGLFDQPDPQAAAARLTALFPAT